LNEAGSRQTGLCLTDPLVGGRRSCCGLSEPTFESRFAKSGVFAGDERSLADLRAGVSRVWVGDNFAGIFEAGHPPADL